MLSVEQAIAALDQDFKKAALERELARVSRAPLRRPAVAAAVPHAVISPPLPLP